MIGFYPITEDVSEWTLEELYAINANIIECKPPRIEAVLGVVEVQR
jgi:hypothetical protein